MPDVKLRTTPLAVKFSKDQSLETLGIEWWEGVLTLGDKGKLGERCQLPGLLPSPAPLSRCALPPDRAEKCSLWRGRNWGSLDQRSAGTGEGVSSKRETDSFSVHDAECWGPWLSFPTGPRESPSQIFTSRWKILENFKSEKL